MLDLQNSKELSTGEVRQSVDRAFFLGISRLGLMLVFKGEVVWFWVMSNEKDRPCLLDSLSHWFNTSLVWMESMYVEYSWSMWLNWWWTRRFQNLCLQNHLISTPRSKTPMDVSTKRVVSYLFLAVTRASLRSSTVGGRCIIRLSSLSLCVSQKMALRRVLYHNQLVARIGYPR